jgi:hypothetical protein
MGATRCDPVLRSRFRSRSALGRRLLLAGVTSWSLSTSACVPAYSRFDEPAPVLAGRDSLARAYDLGVRDAKLTFTRPAAGVRVLAPLLGAGLVLLGVVLARATKNIVMIAVPPVAVLGGVAVKTGIDASRPPASPADSVQSVYGMKSSAMWDNYVNGYRDTINDRNERTFRSSMIGFVATTLALGVLILLFSALRVAVRAA